MSLVSSPRYGGKVELWIQARALVNRGWTPSPRHTYPKRADMRDTHPAESRALSVIRTLVRTVSGKYPKHAAI